MKLDEILALARDVTHGRDCDDTFCERCYPDDEPEQHPMVTLAAWVERVAPHIAELADAVGPGTNKYRDVAAMHRAVRALLAAADGGGR